MKASIYDVLSGPFSDGRWTRENEASSQGMRSIIGNLDRLFNTRRGSVEHLPEYGLPDISEVYRDMPDSIIDLQQAIKAVVERYEPRLRRVRVEHQSTDPHAMQLVFLLSAQLSDRHRVQFRTTFSSNETAYVRSWS